eukprot:CAMPEP_0198146094 /NCGR_PEP_ID=MMETSP1443-20131203/27335_1 /TAXON_ID=186043 /ORGANISM="Entomoneis sp., Strain CCMP2396" /LENGTH=589 /DNA_ID=CAMNT_0043809929 /DNA_START=147 /DNA_END=1916 /DNA_ORIENTATION=+
MTLKLCSFATRFKMPFNAASVTARRMNIGLAFCGGGGGLRRSLATATTLQDMTPAKLALGSHKWTQLGPSYKDIVETAVANGITTVEVGQGPGADEALSNILSQITTTAAKDGGQQNSNISLLKRVGYRTVMQQEFLPGDVQVEQLNQQQQSKAAATAGDKKTTNTTTTTVVHNMGPHGIKQALEQSCLEHNIVLMLHNPEVQATLHSDAAAASRSSSNTGDDDQGGSSNNINDSRQQRIREKLLESFLACEEQISSSNSQTKVSAYGIVSNGMSLPETHPLHLSWSRAVKPALEQAFETLKTPLNFSVVSLPMNLLETSGIPVAKEMRQDLMTSMKDMFKHQAGPEIHALRPLTAYPDQGTGMAGHSFVLADYKVPATMKKEMTWTQEMADDAPPQVYEIALKQAMAHFDATEILQAAEDGQELSTEQRETLDGCKLMQSLLHDVDNGLEQVRSFSLHEEFLSSKIIPLIHDTFESYDDDTAQVLKSFFAAYSLAVRHAIARNTRKLLKEGESANSTDMTVKTPTYPDLPSSMRLQEFAIRFLLSQKQGNKALVDKIVVGCVEPDHVLDDLEMVYQYLSEQEQAAPDR